MRQCKAVYAGATTAGQSNLPGGQGQTRQGNGQSSGQGSSGAGGPSMQAGSANAMAPSDLAQYQSLAQSRGTGWAIGGRGNSAVGVKRPIRIVCESDRLLLVPERGTDNELQIFRHDGSIPAVIDPFVDAVQSRLKGWGIAGQGIFWRPVLQVDVRNDAEGRFRQLIQLLDQKWYRGYTRAMKRTTNAALSEAIGTDAFLDIVANLVGILLIFLMVIGVRMEDASQATKPTVPDVASVEAEALASKPLPKMPVPLMLPEIEVPDATDARLEYSKLTAGIRRADAEAVEIAQQMKLQKLGPRQFDAGHHHGQVEIG